MSNIMKRLEALEKVCESQSIVVLQFADGSRRRAFRAGQRIMEAIMHTMDTEHQQPDHERVVGIESVKGEQSDLLISLFDVLNAPEEITPDFELQS